MKLTVTNRIITQGIPEKFKVAVKERLTFPHIVVLRTIANFGKRNSFLSEQKGDPYHRKRMGVTSDM